MDQNLLQKPKNGGVGGDVVHSCVVRIAKVREVNIEEATEFETLL